MRHPVVSLGATTRAAWIFGVCHVKCLGGELQLTCKCTRVCTLAAAQGVMHVECVLDRLQK